METICLIDFDRAVAEDSMCSSLGPQQLEFLKFGLNIVNGVKINISLHSIAEVRVDEASTIMLLQSQESECYHSCSLQYNVCGLSLQCNS